LILKNIYFYLVKVFY